MRAAHAAHASLACAQAMGGTVVAALVGGRTGSAGRSGTAIAARPVSAQWLGSLPECAGASLDGAVSPCSAWWPW